MNVLTENINYEVIDDLLLLSINTKGHAQSSRSGKFMVIASTHGDMKISNTKLKLGLNLYKPVG